MESEDIVDVYVEETSSRLDGWIVEMNSGWKIYVVVVVLVYMQGIKLMAISGGDGVISRWIISTSRSIWRRTGS